MKELMKSTRFGQIAMGRLEGEGGVLPRIGATIWPFHERHGGVIRVSFGQLGTNTFWDARERLVQGFRETALTCPTLLRTGEVQIEKQEVELEGEPTLDGEIIEAVVRRLRQLEVLEAQDLEAWFAHTIEKREFPARLDS